MSHIDTRMISVRSRVIQPAMATCQIVFARLGQWRQRMLDRRRLGSFNDQMLKDIGLSRADIEDEITKPFWRG